MFTRARKRKKDLGSASFSTTVEEAVVPVHFFNVRLLIVACLLLLIIFLFTAPVTNYFSQRVEISRQEEVVRRGQQENKELLELRERQADEEYVKQQARQRLRMAVPGETPYIVVGKVPEDEKTGTVFAGNKDAVLQGSWSDRVLDSLAQNMYRERISDEKEK